MLRQHIGYVRSKTVFYCKILIRELTRDRQYLQIHQVVDLRAGDSCLLPKPNRLGILLTKQATSLSILTMFVRRLPNLSLLKGFLRTSLADEASTLNEFFGAQITSMTQKKSKAAACAAISALFDVPDAATNGTKLNSVYAQLASYTNPDFLGMDRALNAYKGAVSLVPLNGSSSMTDDLDLHSYGASLSKKSPLMRLHISKSWQTLL